MKFRKWIRIAAFALVLAGLVLGLGTWLLNTYVKTSTSDRILSLDAAKKLNADCILVLGAGVIGESPSHMLEDRLLQGVALYKANASGRLLMSGDHGRKGYDEVNVMKQFARDQGIPSEDVFMDHAGFNTYDSLYRAQAIFQVKKVIIVSQRYHLHRALYIARSLGLDAYGVSADRRKYIGQDMRDAREVLARVKDVLTSLVQPRPQYLGEAIPVSGDGNVTND